MTGRRRGARLFRFIADVLNRSILDEVVAVADEDSFSYARGSPARKVSSQGLRPARRFTRPLQSPAGWKQRVKTLS